MNNKKLNPIVQIVIFVGLSFFCSVSVHGQTATQTALKTKSQGRTASAELKFRQAGVPVFDMVERQGDQVVKVKVIPQLDIGEEPSIISNSLTVTMPKTIVLHLGQTKPMTSPTVVGLSQTFKPFPVDPTPQIFTSPERVSSIPSAPPIKALTKPMLIDAEVQTVALNEIKTDEFKMLQALIFLDHKKKYDLAMALFVELMDSPEFKDQATYHYAETAFGQKLWSEFRQKMLTVAQESKNKDLKIKALKSLVEHIEYLEISDIGLIEPFIEAFDIETSMNSKYSLKKAKYYSKTGNLGAFESALLEISMQSAEYKESVLLKAIFNYRQGQVDSAISDLEMIWPQLQEDKKDQVRNLSALTLARMYFQKGDYKNAYKNYLNVDKSSGQWLQSMVEQAWTQVLAGDYEGAAGNMFSLHTDFFKKAYAPDTYIVRTVGYLNLCQYGDSMSVINDLKKKYQGIHTKLMSFQTNTKNTLKYYDLVKNWMKNSDLTEVEGVPRSFIVELARHPNYMTIQKQINNYEDENSRFNQITIDLIRKERVARLEMLKAKNDFATAKREQSSDMAVQERKFLALAVEHLIYSRARDGIKKMRESALVRLDTEEYTLRMTAATNLQNRYQAFTSTLDNLIDQKEVLSYEIYSGAGDHIRFQMAGGDVNQNKSAPALAPEEDNSYKWKHKGEVWEDEIGHYRSSLKNVCPAEEGLAKNTSN